MNSPAITALIIAPDAGGLQPIYRIPAVRRLVILFKRTGIRRIHIIGHIHPYIPMLSDLLSPDNFHQVENVEKLADLPKDSFFNKNDAFMAVRADLVVDGYSLGLMKTEAENRSALFMPANGTASANGVYLTETKDLTKVLQMLWAPASSSLSLPDGFQTIRGSSGLPCDAGGCDDRRFSPEDSLVCALGGQTEDDDGFMARHVDRRVSRFFSRRLADTAVSPNQITLVGMTIGLTGALFLSSPGYWQEVFGALLFVICIVIDGIDGEVARLKLMESAFGHTLDIVTDNIVHVAVFAGISWGLYRQAGNVLYLQALMVLFGGFALAATAVYYCILRPGPGKAGPSSRSLRLLALMANRDFAYLVLVLAVVNRLDWFLLAAAVGSYFFAALVVTFKLLEIRPARVRE